MAMTSDAIQRKRAPQSAGHGKQSFALRLPECVAVALWRNSDTLPIWR